MKRHTQEILYHLLPAVFWLLAIGGSLVPLWFIPHFAWNYIPAALVLLCMLVLSRIRPHTTAVEASFQVALLLGIASYWLPTVVFLTIPIWIYLISRQLFNIRAFLATFIGYGFVAIWATLAVYMTWIPNVWSHFFAIENAWGWVPTGASVIAWLASTIARQNLRVR